MNSKLLITNKKPIIILAIFIIALTALKLLGVTINLTPSMKKGIYIKSYGKIQRGDYVAACLSDYYKSIGLRNFYLEKGTQCDGAGYIIKKVIAVPGDDIILRKNTITINNVSLKYVTHEKDSRGRVLTHYPKGAYKHINGYWLIGPNSPDSWDSRYWGELNSQQIHYKIKPLIVF